MIIFFALRPHFTPHYKPVAGPGCVQKDANEVQVVKDPSRVLPPRRPIPRLQILSIKPAIP
jgi:hypothetical protein